jgi:hypothetical protein
MSDIKQDFLHTLYGQDILMFKATLTSTGLDVDMQRMSVDAKCPQVAPAAGCDIIIHGSSTRTANIIEWNPNVTNDNLQTHRTNDGELVLTTYCYCAPSNEPETKTIIANTLKLAGIEEQARLAALADKWQTLINAW